MQNKVSPRQRLINMMYLVLLALLALNIQVDFIDAFFDISKSIERTVERDNFEHNQSVNSIKKAFELDSNSYYNSYKNSVRAEQIAFQSTRFIDSLRDVLLLKTGGFNEHGFPNNSISSRVSDNIFMQRKGARELKTILQESKEEFLKLMPKSEVHQLQNIYESSDFIINSRGVKLSWEEYHFNNLALGGSLALLSRFKNDITAMKSVILNYYLNDIYGELTDFIVNGIEDSISVEIGVVNAESFEVGEEIKIKIQLPKFEKINKTNIVLLDKNHQLIKDTKIDKTQNLIYYTPKEKGEYTIKAEVMDSLNNLVDSITKRFNVIDVETKYLVIDEVIKTKYNNILYLGLKNEIEVSHPDYTYKKLFLSTSNGFINKKNGAFIYTAENIGKTDIRIIVNNKTIAKKSFNIKRLPDPNITMNFASNNIISSKLLRIQNSLNIEVDDEDFENAYQIKSFDVIKLNQNGDQIFNEKNNSEYFVGEVKNQIRDANSGETYIFTNILVKSSDGLSRISPTLLIKVN
ncbi:MAG: GldM family protein [Flavobacteriales bacterium]|nr:GldM family protein [Flavobacteriales bacterium]